MTGTNVNWPALDTTAHLHITASAGSGKTKNLVDRLCKLLLQGIEPRSLVCLTFTKNAAQEMTERLYQRLSSWVQLDDNDLEDQLHALGESDNKLARHIFFHILDNPPRIQTLHSFCHGLLMRFPLESGIPPGVNLCDELQHQLLKEEALQITFKDLNASVKTALATHISQKDLHASLDIILETLLADSSSGNAKVYPESALHTPYPPKDLIPHRHLQTHIPLLTELATQFASLPSLQKLSEALNEFIYQPNSSTYPQLTSLLITQKGSPRVLRGLSPPYQASVTHLQQLILVTNARHRRAQATYAGDLLSYIAHHLKETYTYLLRSAGLMTYDTLVMAATRLLSQHETPWVLQVLHKEISHILVDEAQDNSHPQWTIITTLLEILCGPHQTLFIVGDPKQSIYGFQGATPKAFQAFENYLNATAYETQKPCHKHMLDTSYRSSPVILQAVDAIFQPLWGADVHHKPCEAKRASLGRVELWPALLATTAEAEVKVANHIANTLITLLQKPLFTTGLKTKPQDILVLLRRRGTFCETLVRALKRKGIPVAGTDRFMLNQEIVIQDLMAVGWFVLLPDDDLNLATLLKGPFFHCHEDDIFLLGYDRHRGNDHRHRSTSLWQRLCHADASSPWGPIAAILTTWQAARNQAPYAFFQAIIYKYHGSTQLMRHSGAEAREPIDAFLQLAFRYECLYPASLQGFMKWISQEGRVMARSPQAFPEALRLMTIHGAKGLQAPIVFLLDACTPPRKLPPLLQKDNQWFYCPSGISVPPDIAQQRDSLACEMHEEYQRLLYVALTRAQEQVYIWQWGASPPPSNCWHSWISQGLNRLSETRNLSFEGPGKGFCQALGSLHPPSLDCWVNAHPFRHQRPEWPSFERLKDTFYHPDSLVNLPPVAHQQEYLHARFQDKALSTATPTGIDETAHPPIWDPLLTSHHQLPENSTTCSHTATPPQADIEGILWHAVLERVPPTLNCKATDELANWLKTILNQLGATDAYATQSLPILHRVIQTYSHFFGPNSCSEVSAITTQGKYFLGRVDRLVNTPRSLLIIDFKRHVSLPIPLDFYHQLMNYRRLFKPLAQTKGQSCQTFLLSLDDACLYQLTPGAPPKN